MGGGGGGEGAVEYRGTSLLKTALDIAVRSVEREVSLIQRFVHSSLYSKDSGQ